jgi:hypothetical protein
LFIGHALAIDQNLDHPCRWLNLDDELVTLDVRLAAQNLLLIGSRRGVDIRRLGRCVCGTD